MGKETASLVICLHNRNGVWVERTLLNLKSDCKCNSFLVWHFFLGLAEAGCFKYYNTEGFIIVKRMFKVHAERFFFYKSNPPNFEPVNRFTIIFSVINILLEFFGT